MLTLQHSCSLLLLLPPLTSPQVPPAMGCKISLGKMSTARHPEPVCRKFIPVEHSESTSISKPDGFKFRLVSYNILAQAYVRDKFFPHSPSPCLEWNARSQSILAVLKSLESDFLCLQELDEYDTFYKENVEKNGYKSIYIQRSGQRRDGCGIFYKPNKSELVMQEKVYYNDLVDLVQDKGMEKTPGIGGDPNDLSVRLKRDGVGVIAAFKLNDPSKCFVIVANTHLYWDPKCADVKLAQAKYLLSRISQFKVMISNRYKCTPSVIIAGDFNSVPGDKVHQYLISGSSSVAPLSECSEDRPIPLASVYASTRGEPLFTTFTPRSKVTIDHIFFTPAGEIKPVGLLELPEAESPDLNGGLPNYFHPSDHLPIGAEFLVV